MPVDLMSNSKFYEYYHIMRVTAVLVILGILYDVENERGHLTLFIHSDSAEDVYVDEAVTKLRSLELWETVAIRYSSFQP